LENEGFSLCYGSDWKSYSTIFNTYSNLECKSGRTTGQNVNYEYCSRKYSFNPVLFCIKKTVLDSSGTVKDVIKKCVESYVRNPNANQVIDVKCVNPPQEISC